MAGDDAGGGFEGCNTEGCNTQGDDAQGDDAQGDDTEGCRAEDNDAEGDDAEDNDAEGCRASRSCNAESTHSAQGWHVQTYPTRNRQCKGPGRRPSQARVKARRPNGRAETAANLCSADSCGAR